MRPVRGTVATALARSALVLAAATLCHAACTPSTETDDGSTGKASKDAGAEPSEADAADDSADPAPQGPGPSTDAAASNVDSGPMAQPDTGAVSAPPDASAPPRPPPDAALSFPDVTFVYDPPIFTKDACANERAEATPLPLTIYLMLDASGSMGSSGIWDPARQAIKDFVNHPDSAGNNVALGYFSGSTCTGYEVPAVGPVLLPGGAQAISNSLDAATNGGSTPTEGALRGLTTFCTNYEANNPGETCVGVLITDGEPKACTVQDSAGLAQIAAAAYANGAGVRTYTMGLTGLTQAGWDLIHAVAKAGGGDCVPADNPNLLYACDATSGSQAFVDALSLIRDQFIACDYAIPTPATGVLDLDALDVLVSSSASATPQALPKVTDAASCGAASGGWHYDSLVNPQRIVLCDSTCNVLRTLDQPRIDIEVPCQGS